MWELIERIPNGGYWYNADERLIRFTYGIKKPTTQGGYSNLAAYANERGDKIKTPDNVLTIKYYFNTYRTFGCSDKQAKDSVENAFGTQSQYVWDQIIGGDQCQSQKLSELL